MLDTKGMNPKNLHPVVKATSLSLETMHMSGPKPLVYIPRTLQCLMQLVRT